MCWNTRSSWCHCFLSRGENPFTRNTRCLDWDNIHCKTKNARVSILMFLQYILISKSWVMENRTTCQNSKTPVPSFGSLRYWFISLSTEKVGWPAFCGLFNLRISAAVGRDGFSAGGWSKIVDVSGLTARTYSDFFNTY